MFSSVSAPNIARHIQYKKFCCFSFVFYCFAWKSRESLRFTVSRFLQRKNCISNSHTKLCDCVFVACPRLDVCLKSSQSPSSSSSLQCSIVSAIHHDLSTLCLSLSHLSSVSLILTHSQWMHTIRIRLISNTLFWGFFFLFPFRLSF